MRHLSAWQKASLSVCGRPPDAPPLRVLVTGASRGIGRAVAAVFAQKLGAGVSVALLGRSLREPSHAKLRGTLQEAAAEVESHGAIAIPVQADLADGPSTEAALQAAITSLRGLDVLVNNASVLVTDPTPPRRHIDLMHAVNTRGTLLALHAARPFLQASGGTVVTMSPPADVASRRSNVSPHAAYTLSKISMTLATLAENDWGVRANCLWPARTVATAATRLLEQRGNEGVYSRGRRAEDVAAVVYELAVRRRDLRGQALLDEELVDMRATAAPKDLFVD